MATSVQCPTLDNISCEDMCLEHFSGMGSVAYFFLRDDINKANFTATENVYEFTDETLKTGKHLFRVELKEAGQQFNGESNAQGKGFKITANMIIEVINEKVGKLCRALNNLQWGCIIEDSDPGKYQLFYSPNKKVKIDGGGIKTDTGLQSSDDSQTTIAAYIISNYPNLYVKFPEGKTPDDYLSVAAG